MNFYNEHLKKSLDNKHNMYFLNIIMQQKYKTKW